MPFIHHVLEWVVKKHAYNFFDEFFGYQPSVKEENKSKVAFSIGWGIFIDCVMPFGLVNTLGRFHKLLSYGFNAYIQVYVEIFMDDLCIDSIKWK